MPRKEKLKTKKCSKCVHSIEQDNTNFCTEYQETIHEDVYDNKMECDLFERKET